MSDDLIRCTRVDPPAKPSREEVIHRSILQCLRSRPDEISRAIERALTAWEADNPVPTYRIELDAETFEALTGTDGPSGTLAHDALMRAIQRCAHPQGEDDDDRKYRQLREQTEADIASGKVDVEIAEALAEAGLAEVDRPLTHAEWHESLGNDPPAKSGEACPCGWSVSVHAPPVGTAGAELSGGEGKQEENYVWYSLCSAHQQIDPQCRRCHAGEWIDDNDPKVIADRQLYETDPGEWIRRHNQTPNRCPGNIVTAEELAEAWHESRCPCATAEGWPIGHQDTAPLKKMSTAYQRVLNATASEVLARFFPEHIAKPATSAAPTVERCGRDFGGVGRCVRPKGHPRHKGEWMDSMGCGTVWRPEDGPEPTEPVVYGGDGTVRR